MRYYKESRRKGTSYITQKIRKNISTGNVLCTNYLSNTFIE